MGRTPASSRRLGSIPSSQPKPAPPPTPEPPKRWRPDRALSIQKKHATPAAEQPPGLRGFYPPPTPQSPPRSAQNTLRAVPPGHEARSFEVYVDATLGLLDEFQSREKLKAEAAQEERIAAEYRASSRQGGASERGVAVPAEPPDNEFIMANMDEQLLHPWVNEQPFTSRVAKRKLALLAPAQLKMRMRTIARLSRNDCTFALCKMAGELIDDEWCAAFSDALAQNTFLEVLLLSNNEIGDDGATALAATCARHPMIKVLALGGNRVGDAGARALAHLLEGRNARLKDLNLAASERPFERRYRRKPALPRIGPSGGAALARALRSNTALTAINLAHNALADEGASALAAMLRGNGTLVSLDVSHNAIDASGAAALAAACEENAALTSLDLTCNRAGDAGAAALANALRTNRALRAVDLCRNEVGEMGVENLRYALLGNERLASLGIYGNPGAALADGTAIENLVDARRHDLLAYRSRFELTTPQPSPAAAPGGQRRLASQSGGARSGTAALSAGGPGSPSRSPLPVSGIGPDGTWGTLFTNERPLDFGTASSSGSLRRVTFELNSAGSAASLGTSSMLGFPKVAPPIEYLAEDYVDEALDYDSDNDDFSEPVKGFGFDDDEGRPARRYPIRSQVYDHKDSNVNYLFLREHEKGADLDAPARSIVHNAGARMRMRAERKLLSREASHQIVKRSNLSKKNNPSCVPSDQVPPLSYLAQMRRDLIKKYPGGIDMAKKGPQYRRKKAVVHKFRDPAPWGDPNMATVRYLSSKMT